MFFKGIGPRNTLPYGYGNLRITHISYIKLYVCIYTGNLSVYFKFLIVLPNMRSFTSLWAIKTKKSVHVQYNLKCAYNLIQG